MQLKYDEKATNNIKKGKINEYKNKHIILRLNGKDYGVLASLQTDYALVRKLWRQENGGLRPIREEAYLISIKAIEVYGFVEKDENNKEI